ncbi:unnamed protein product [Toxocara canis]|uniref:Uncharacterized protein n=1 Tax=Toxocara canis TaxID=6265 RepID=A0A183U8B2_TOXCA|nr:unnamed protein product [Toxocara canis]
MKLLESPIGVSFTKHAGRFQKPAFPAKYSQPPVQRKAESGAGRNEAHRIQLRRWKGFGEEREARCL